MRSLLSLLVRPKVRDRRPVVRFESLEDRLAPAATSLYVITQDPPPGYVGSASTLKEFTPSGSLVRTVPVVRGSVMGEQAHDVVVTDDRRIHIYTGTTDAALWTYDGSRVEGQWTGRGQGGTSTDVAAIGSGGLARFGYDVFMTDMPIPGSDTTQGIVWFNVQNASGPVWRFAEDHAPIDVAAGLDGKLYSLDALGVVRVFDPNPNPPEPPLFPQTRSVTLPDLVFVQGVGTVDMDYRAIAVDGTGNIYAADWNGYLVKFNAAGVPGASRRLPVVSSPNQPVVVENLVDIDFVPAPLYDLSALLVGSTNGVIARTDTSNLFFRQAFDAGEGPAYLTIAPALVEVRVTGPAANVTEGNEGVTPVEFTVTLSRPSADEVAVSWTTAAGTGTAGVDYESGSGTLVFEPGETTKTVAVNVIGDRVDELNESFHVRISAPAGAPPRAVYANTQASAVIADDDPTATATPAFAVSAGDARDGNGDGVFETLSRTTGTLQPFHNTAAFEKRSVIEFDTLGINLAAAPDVTLDLYVELPFIDSTTFRVYGYAGDGGATVADVSAATTLLGTLDWLSEPGLATAWRRITLDRDALAGLMALGRYVGIVIAADTPTVFNIRGTGSAHAPRINFWTASPPVLPVLSVQGFEAVEGNPGGTARSGLFNVTLSQPVTIPVTVDYATRDQPGVTAGVDYVATSGTLTFNPGETSKDVWVEIKPDTMFELDETFYFDLSSPTLASFRYLSAGGTIINDDVGPTVGSSSFAVQEGNSGSLIKNVLVSLSNASYQTITVNYATADVTTTAGTDYTAASGTLTFAPGETTKAVPITIFGDTTYEASEDFKFNLSAVTNATIAGTGSTIQTILNDDAVPTLTVGNWSGPEDGLPGGDNRYRILVSLSNPSYLPVSFNYSMADGTATAGVDYGQFPPGSATISPGGMGYEFLGTIGVDNHYEADETFTFTIANPTNATLGAARVGTGTILNDDSRPTIIVNSQSVTEGDSGTKTMTFTVSLSNRSYQTITVDYATANGTATAGSDYTATSGTLTFAPNDLAKAVTVTVSGDTMFEANETFTLALSNPTNASLGSPATGTGTITNDDAAPTVAVNSPSVAEGDSGTTDLTFTVSLSNPSGAPIVVGYATADLTATAGSDYTEASSTVTFAPGETSKSVVVSVTGDRTREPDETVKLNATLGSTTVSGTGTITNDDPVPTVSASAVTIAEGTAGESPVATFAVSLSNPSSQTVSVDYQTVDGSATVANSDYVATSGTLTFAPGETSKSVPVTIRGDTTYEPAETFALALSNSTNAELGSDGTGTISNDDAFPTVQIAGASVAEGNSGTTPMTFAVTLSNPSYQAVSVNYATVDGTAVAGSDFTATGGTLTIAAGQTQAQVVVNVSGDTLYEGAEQFLVQLSSPVNASLGTSQATGTIGDDDRPTVSGAPTSVAEGDTGTQPLTFTLTLSNPSVESVTVDYQTANGTATAGSDYTATSGGVTFAPGQTTKTVPVTVVGETDLEADETVKLQLTLPAGTNATLGTSSVTGTITNDDFAPVANAGPDQSANEGAAVAFDASGSSDADGDPLTFSWNFGDGSTGTGVTPTHAYADNGTYTVTLTANDGHGGISTDTAIVTVQNVAPTAGVIGPATGVRGQMQTFTLTATDPSAVDRASPFGYRIDWGDGTTGTVTGPAGGALAGHVFTAAGSYTVRVWAKDKDGAEGASASRTYTSKVFEVQGTDLVVGGTTAADQIRFTATVTANTLQLAINGASQGTVTAAGQIAVYAQGGNDLVDFATVKVRGVTYRVGQPLLLFGDAGNDTLDARNASGAAALVGGVGDDLLYGGSGRALLFGGAGADTLRGGSADDVLISGLTTFDTKPTILALLRTEWARTDADYATRRGHLLGPTGGHNGTNFLSPANVTTDGTAVDQLYGNGGQDWYFAAPTDRLNDRQPTETVTGL